MENEIYILSLFFAKVGKIALDEITKLILSMCVFVITLIAVNKRNMRFTLNFFAGVLGILGLLNIDLAGAELEMVGLSEREFLLKNSIGKVKNDFIFALEK